MKLLNKCPAYSWRGVNKDANSVTEQMVCGRYYGNSYPYALNMPTENKSKIGTLSATRARQLKSDPGEWDSENTVTSTKWSLFSKSGLKFGSCQEGG